MKIDDKILLVGISQKLTSMTVAEPTSPGLDSHGSVIAVSDTRGKCAGNSPRSGQGIEVAQDLMDGS